MFGTALTRISAVPSDATLSYDDVADEDDIIAHNERKRPPRERRHIYNENYVSDDQNNGKWVWNS